MVLIYEIKIIKITADLSCMGQAGKQIDLIDHVHACPDQAAYLPVTRRIWPALDGDGLGIESLFFIVRIVLKGIGQMKKGTGNLLFNRAHQDHFDDQQRVQHQSRSQIEPVPELVILIHRNIVRLGSRIREKSFDGGLIGCLQVRFQINCILVQHDRAEGGGHYAYDQKGQHHSFIDGDRPVADQRNDDNYRDPYDHDQIVFDHMG